MISIEEIKEKQEELNKMIEEYESQKEVVKNDLISPWYKNWKPEKNETYYCIPYWKDVFCKKFIMDSDDLIFIKYNRVFPTEELAKKWLEIDTYLREKSFEPNWNDHNQRKWYLFYDFYNNQFGFEYNYDICYFTNFYFEREEIQGEIFKKYTTEELEFYFNRGE